MFEVIDYDTCFFRFQDDEIIDRDSMYDSVIPSVFGDLKTLQQKSDDWLIRSGQQKCELQDLAKNLNKIIARLVTDYRAIFAIEVEFSRSFEKWVLNITIKKLDQQQSNFNALPFF